jgi:uncharacterized protein YbjT (DUF2867 family)
MMKNPTILVAGASGYIGKAVIPHLLIKFPEAQIIALSRSQQKSNDPRVTWRACDLFSLKSLEEALPKKVDLALYLVHSMGPTAHLDQGSFADYDLILADNFARAIKNSGVQQVIYLTGLIPETEKLSLHLQSRLEVEQTFAQFNLPTTTLRAGLILGEAGSSFQILIKLVKRLPIMICPHWTQTLNTPVDLQTVLTTITSSALSLEHIGHIYDLAGCQPITYLQMMRETAKRIGVRRLFFTVPLFTPTLSRLWVSLITNTSKNLVYPLIESLEKPMVAQESRQFSSEWHNKTYSELLEKVSVQTQPSAPLFKFSVPQKTVRSVQRLPLPPGKSAEWVKDQYIYWLPRFLTPFIKVQVNATQLIFAAFSIKFVLIEMKVDNDQKHSDRQLLSIVKGLLVSQNNRGRLEFLEVLNGKFVLAAIHDYRPSLPWFIYMYTQAKLHWLVMRFFSSYLEKKARDGEK